MPDVTAGYDTTPFGGLLLHELIILLQANALTFSFLFRSLPLPLFCARVAARCSIAFGFDRFLFLTSFGLTGFYL